MQNDILIISDSLLEPPSETFAVRTVTMICHYDLNMSVLVHTTQEMKDLYYKWMKSMGLMDYIDDFLMELEWEDGVRIDIINVYPNTIVVKSLRLENQLSVLGQIKELTGK